MKLNFSTTIGQRAFLVVDDEDNGAPMLSLSFHNEFNKLSFESKRLIAENVLAVASTLCQNAMACKELPPSLGGYNESKQTDNS